ncbi:MAG: hypothetical protein AMJ55_13425 [Gammaproteobacteria bacterium SG8_15]|nr:MAG: hypothetical protein AMJ55_13425 [Gammaproteobacteria bacterium SG8_15]
MKINNLRNFTLAGIATAVMLGCGGSGDSSTSASGGSTGITTVGAITGFGSVYVNGIKFETESAEYEVEDESAFDDSALRVGMVVKVKGRINDDGRTGTANQIIYEDEIEGQVQGLTTEGTDLKHFTIFTVPVTVSRTNTFFDNGLSFDNLQNDTFVEVSGYFDGQAIQATYIKRENDFDAEVKGEVSNSNGVDQFTLTTIYGAQITVTVVGGAKDRHHLSDDEGEIEILGLLTENNGSYFLNGMPATLSSSIRYEPPELESTINNLPPEGMMVKIHGDYRNGTLVIDRIENKQESLEFKGRVADISASAAKTGIVTISFSPADGTVTVNLDSSTMYADDDSNSQFDLRTDVGINDYVEVKAMQDQSGVIVATLLDVDDTVGEYEVEGPLDNFFDNSTITAMNVTFSVNDAITSYPFGKPQAGDIVDITDLNRDGVADIVEIED